MKKRFLSMLLTIVLLITVCIIPSAYATPNYGNTDIFPVCVSDLDEYESNPNIARAFGTNIARGVEDGATGIGYISPKDTITLEATMALVARAINISGAYNNINGIGKITEMFEDINMYWSKTELLILDKSGWGDKMFGYIASGRRYYDSSYYSVSNKKTFEENIRKTAHIEEYIPILVDMSGYGSRAESYGGYPDGYMKAAEEIGLLNGTGYNRYSRGEFNRAESIIIIDNFLARPIQNDINGTCITEYSKAGYKTSYGRFSYVGSNTAKFVPAASGYETTINSVSSLSDGFEALKPFEGKNGVALIKLDKSINTWNDGICFFMPGPFDIKMSPNGGYSTTDSCMGDTFETTIITPVSTKSISLLADMLKGSEWYEMPFEDLKSYGYLTSEPTNNGDGTKTWKLRFPIYDAGYRKFILKADNINTGVYTQIQVNQNTGTPKTEVNVNGNSVDFDVPPQIINGRTMIPIRAVAEALGCEVTWYDLTKTATIRYKNSQKSINRVCNIQIGNPVMTWEDDAGWLNGGNGGIETLDSPAVIVDGRTLVPIRAIAEVFDFDVKWNETTREVIITE